MPTNEGMVDRIVRVVLGIVLIIVGFFAIDNWFGIVLGIIGIVVLATGAVGHCLLYRVLGINTNKS